MSRIKENKFTFKDIDIVYKFRGSKYDRKFLIVIFSGFRPTGSQYDFDGKGTDALAANLLWIKDSFNESPSYYIRTASGFAVAEAIQELIAKILSGLGLEKHHCLLAGFSKGGSGALFHGLKYDYTNILTAVPRMNIGSANQIERPDLLKSLAPDTSQESVKMLDAILPSLLKGDLNRSRNIYLISSEQDEQYRTEISPFLDLYSTYDNFNLILTSSPLVVQHADVTRYNMPNIYAIMALLTDGIVPTFGKVQNGLHQHQSNIPIPSSVPSEGEDRRVGEFSSISFKKNSIYPEGHAFLLGQEATSHANIKLNLSFDNSEVNSRFPLGTVQNSHISARYFKHTYRDYSFAGFASPKFGGIDITNLPLGVTNLSFDIKHNGINSNIHPSSSRIIDSWHILQSSLLHIESNTSGAKLVRRSSFGRQSGDTIFDLKRLVICDSRLYIEGHFIQPGIPTPIYGDVVYYLVLRSLEKGLPDYTLPLANGNKSYIKSIIDDEFNDYSKSYFTTLRYEGFDVQNLAAGKYAMYVTARFRTSLFTVDLKHQLSLGKMPVIFETLGSVSVPQRQIW